jgi:hypothetical protein
MNFDWQGFGRDVRAFRERRKLGLRECCRSMPINPATWSRAENGKPIEVPHFVFLCEWIGRRPAAYAISAPRPRAMK